MTHATIGSLTAKTTRKLARKKPHLNKLYLLQKYWQHIVPKNFAQYSTPVAVSAVKEPNLNPQYLATISVQSYFAPIALHESPQLLAAIQNYFGRNFLHTIRLTQFREN